MAKRTTQTNYRVVIYPHGLGDFGSISMSDSMFCTDEADRQRQYKARCEEIARDAKRHVDDVGQIVVEHDDEDECEHCGSRWTEKSSDYNGGCCSKDEEAQLSREQQK